MLTEEPFQAELVLASRFESIEIAIVVLQECLQQTEVESSVANRVEFALREALANAIRHGNGVDSSDPIQLELELSGLELLIRVSDKGKGFAIEEVLDPLLDDHLLKSHGRGILVMREYMGSVSFSQTDQGGTIVTMSRKLT